MENNDIVRMANQIAGFFKSYGPVEGTKELAAHINNFWEPRMRAEFFKVLESGGEGLDSMVKAAAPQIRQPNAAPSAKREVKDAKSGLPKNAKEA